MTIEEVRFALDIPAEDYLRHYQGAARQVKVRAHDGRIVQFPAAALRRFVTREGVHGEFALEFDADRRLTGIRRVR